MLTDSFNRSFFELNRFLGGLTLSISYGIPIQSKNDPYVRLAEKAIAGIRLAETEEETYLVDRYPILKYVPEWVPGASWKRNAMKWRSWEVDMREKPFDMALKSIVSRPALSPYLALERMALGPDCIIEEWKV